MSPLSRWLLVFGFTALVLAGLCLFFYGNQFLHYRGFGINAIVLGRYLLGIGLIFYVAGRALYYGRRFKQRRQKAREEIF